MQHLIAKEEKRLIIHYLEFEHIVVTIQDTRNSETMTKEKPKGTLQAYKEKHKKKKEVIGKLFKMQLKEKEES